MLKQNATRIGFSLSVLAFYLTCAVWAFLGIAKWPGVGNWWVLTYFFIFPAFIHRAFNLFYFFWQKKRLEEKWKKLLVVVLSITLGFVLTGLINKKASSWAMEKFQNNYQPLIEQLQNNPSSPCKSMNEFINTQHLHGREKPKSLHFNGEHFILIFLGGSIDIDGSTIYFDSQLGQWNLFHNDMTTNKIQLDMLVKEMKTCGQER